MLDFKKYRITVFILLFVAATRVSANANDSSFCENLHLKYLEYREWVLSIDFSNEYDRSDIELLRQKQASWLNTTETTNSEKTRENLINWQKAEAKINEITAYATESCLYGEDEQSVVWYKGSPSVDSDTTRVNVYMDSNGKIDSISFERRGLEERIDEGKIYKPI